MNIFINFSLIILLTVPLVADKQPPASLASIQKWLCKVIENSPTSDPFADFPERPTQKPSYEKKEIRTRRTTKYVQEGTLKGYIHDYTLLTSNLKVEYSYHQNIINFRGGSTNEVHAFRIEIHPRRATNDILWIKSHSEARQWLSRYGKVIVDSAVPEVLHAVADYDDEIADGAVDYMSYNWSVGFSTEFQEIEITWSEPSYAHHGRKFCNH